MAVYPHPESQGFAILLRALSIFGCLMAFIGIVGIVIGAIALVMEGRFAWAELLLIGDLFCASLFAAWAIESL